MGDTVSVGGREFELPWAGPSVWALEGARWVKEISEQVSSPGGVFDVRSHGALGDGETDDTAAIQAAIDAALVTGGDVLIPAGYYRVTGTLNVGLPEWDDFGFLVDRTRALDDTDFNAHRIPANVTANFQKTGIAIRFSDGAFLVADMAPSAHTPVISYNLHAAYLKEGAIYGAAIIGNSAYVGGKYVFPSAIVTDNIIGIYAAAGCKVMERPFISAVGHGIVTSNTYWTRISDARVEWASECMSVAQANAAVISNVVCWYSTRGLVFDGDAGLVECFHTQQVKEDLVIFKASGSLFGPAYLEDSEPGDGTGKYAVTLGMTNDALEVLHCEFLGVRIASTRTNKGAFLLRGSRDIIVSNCRAHSKPVNTDTLSTGTMFECDFDVPSSGKFSGIASGSLWGHLTVLLNEGGVQFGSKWLLQRVGTELYIRDTANARMLAQFHGSALSSDSSINLNASVMLDAALYLKSVTLTYSASISVDATKGTEFVITATNATPFTINSPINSVAGERITMRIRNMSGGALGAITWGGLYKMAAWTSPANAFSRAIDFMFNGTNWIETSRTPADVPN